MSAMAWMIQRGVPERISFAFVLLTLGTALAIYALFLTKIKPAARGTRVALGLLAWAAVQGGLARQGFFIEYAGTRPPVLLLILIPNIAALVWLARSKKALASFKGLSPTWLVGVQVFRIPVELILANLSEHHLIPEVMSWHGRNFDILTGVTAPLVAWLFATKRISASVVRIWNWAGLALLTNVVMHAFLTLPPISLIHSPVPNMLPSLFPFVWLPGILVPFAYALHIASLRTLGRK